MTNGVVPDRSVPAASVWVRRPAISKIARSNCLPASSAGTRRLSRNGSPARTGRGTSRASEDTERSTPVTIGRAPQGPFKVIDLLDRAPRASVTVTVTTTVCAWRRVRRASLGLAVGGEITKETFDHENVNGSRLSGLLADALM